MSERDALKKQAEDLGLQFPGNISTNKLAKLIEDAKTSTQDAPPESDGAGGDTSSSAQSAGPTEKADPGEQTSPQVASDQPEGAGVAAPAPETQTGPTETDEDAGVQASQGVDQRAGAGTSDPAPVTQPDPEPEPNPEPFHRVKVLSPVRFNGKRYAPGNPKANVIDNLPDDALPGLVACGAVELLTE